MYPGRSRWPIVVSFALLVACSSKSSEVRKQPVSLLDEGLAREALLTYLQIADATYHDSVTGAERLSTAVEALLAAPSAERLTAAQQAWLSARSAYAQSEVFRFYDGPIDQVELLVNTWPIDEGYVEADSSDPTAPGIIDDVKRYPELSEELLTQLNARDGETAISTGYHVIEFLLWGRDGNAAGPGQRTYQDFVVKGAGEKAQGDALAARRGQYLRLSVALLLRHLRQVQTAFAPDVSDNYREQFVHAAPADGVYRALKGMAKLSGPELSGERMTVPYETKNQENEHSCFSDSTQRDLLGNARGVENVCLGRYKREDGSELKRVGLCELLRRALPQLGAALIAQISASVRAVAAIPAPFDQAILGDDAAPGRSAIRRAIEGLRRQAELIDQARAALNLSDPAPLLVAR